MLAALILLLIDPAIVDGFFSPQSGGVDAIDVRVDGDTDVTVVGEDESAVKALITTNNCMNTFTNNHKHEYLNNHFMNNYNVFRKYSSRPTRSYIFLEYCLWH